MSRAVSPRVYISLLQMAWPWPCSRMPRACYDSPARVCQKFHAVPLPTAESSNTVRSVWVSGSSSRADCTVAWSCCTALSWSGPTQNRLLSMSPGKWTRGIFLAVECCHQNPKRPNWLCVSFFWKGCKMKNICILFWRGYSGMSLIIRVLKYFNEVVSPWIFIPPGTHMFNQGVQHNNCSMLVLYN